MGDEGKVMAQRCGNGGEVVRKWRNSGEKARVWFSSESKISGI